MTLEAPDTALLRVDSISKAFGATQALKNVSFDVRPGEVHALMGENGAGKSTLMKIISGIHQSDGGQIYVNGERVGFDGPREAQAAGIAIIHQELNVIPEMTVAENLAVGREPTNRFGVLDRRRMRADATEKLARVHAEISPNALMGSLSVGMQQMVEIARAVAEEARVLVLDEPTAALSRSESDRLFALIRSMRADGMGLVYISHRMEEVWELSDRITVFRDGALVTTVDRGELTPSQVVNRMVGRDVDDLYVRSDRELGETVLSVRGLTDGQKVGPADLTVRAGEVVGMVGLIGAGRTEFARMVYGADRRVAGDIRIGGKSFSPSSPKKSIRRGISLLPESRKAQALFLEMSVADNESVSVLDKFSRIGVILRKTLHRNVKSTADRLNVKASSLAAPISSLSGGNQQKVVLGRVLLQGPDVIILDEPTRGVDIGAKNEIYQIIDELARSGKAVVLISSDLPEALGISDLLVVMRQGQIVAELDARSATEELVMAHATGVYGTEE